MDDKNIDRFNKAVSFISPIVKNILLALPDDMKLSIQEIRMRSGRPVMIIGLRGTFFLNANGRLSGISNENSIKMSLADINDTFNRLCGYSIHSHRSNIINGYITVEGGHRAGICGTAVNENGAVTGVRDVSSVNLRIAGEHTGAADEIIKRLFCKELCSIIIAGPPSSGKTTVLRDLARQLSNGSCEKYYKTAIIDEREEIAAISQGIAQNDIGLNCDVLNAYPKGEAILTALRSLSPEIIICDEVGSLKEIEAIEAGVNSGVKFAVSIHAANHDELINRPQIRRLLMTFAFDHLVLLKGTGLPCRIAKLYRTGELIDEIGRGIVVNSGLQPVGAIFQPTA